MHAQPDDLAQHQRELARLLEKDRPPVKQPRLLLAAENFPSIMSDAGVLAPFGGEVSFRQRSLARDIQYPLEAITRWTRGVEDVTMKSTWADVTDAEIRREPTSDRRRAAKGTVCWASNHCSSHSGREDYVRELQRHIPVEVYTAPCLKNAPQEHVQLTQEGQWALWRSYKFYLAFENTRCLDYFTEKLYLAFSRGQVPVVLGGANIAEHAPSAGSYIDVRDFPSPRALAEHLRYLDGNDTAYEEMFAWHALPFEEYGVGLREAIRTALPTARKNGGWAKSASFFVCALCEGLERWAGRGRPAVEVPPFQCEGPVTVHANGSVAL